MNQGVKVHDAVPLDVYPHGLSVLGIREHRPWLAGVPARRLMSDQAACGGAVLPTPRHQLRGVVRATMRSLVCFQCRDSDGVKGGELDVV